MGIRMMPGLSSKRPVTAGPSTGRARIQPPTTRTASAMTTNARPFHAPELALR